LFYLVLLGGIALQRKQFRLFLPISP